MAPQDDVTDLEELISYLTPREENEMIKSYQNTTAMACPACGDPFDDLVVCKAEFTELTLSAEMDLCVTTDDAERPFLFTHKH
ncbi:MAG: hypothetical protein ABEJ55_01905 [Halanaeroarchaeum sp.]